MLTTYLLINFTFDNIKLKYYYKFCISMCMVQFISFLVCFQGYHLVKHHSFHVLLLLLKWLI